MSDRYLILKQVVEEKFTATEVVEILFYTHVLAACAGMVIYLLILMGLNRAGKGGFDHE